MTIHLNPTAGRYLQSVQKTATPITFGSEASPDANGAPVSDSKNDPKNGSKKIPIPKRFTAFFSRKNIAEGIYAAEKRTNEIFTSKGKAVWEITKLFAEIGLLAFSSGLYLPLALAFPKLLLSGFSKSFITGVQQAAANEPATPDIPSESQPG